MNNYFDYQIVRHKSGLNVVFLPMKNYNTSYAMLGADYGSVDTEFLVNGKKVSVPAGTAHFLEHKLFENEDSDAFEEYAKTGASANAYTSFDKTCYLFRTTQNFKESLEILLKYTLNPYFSEKTVKKEQGIIAEEIKMYQDNPSWRAFFGVLSGLYHNHPVRTDIAGTVESISEITPEVLYDCFNAFYNVNNMVLAVSGAFSKEEVFESLDKMIKESRPVKVEKILTNEPKTVKNSLVKCNLPVSSPVYSIGFKGSVDSGNILKEELLAALSLDILAGDISDFYRDMYNSGIINNSFSTEVFSGKDYLSFIFEGEGGKPEEVLNNITKSVEKIKKDFPKELFETAKRELFGRHIRATDSVDNIASLGVSMFFGGYKPDMAIKTLLGITAEETHDYFKKAFNCENKTMCLVEKEDKK